PPLRKPALVGADLSAIPRQRAGNSKHPSPLKRLPQKPGPLPPPSWRTSPPCLNRFPLARIQAGKMNALCIAATSFMQPELPAASSDDDTVRAAVAGDRKAFEALYRRHADRVYGA